LELKGTYTWDLIFPTTQSLSLVGYNDTNWAGCFDTWKSVNGWCVFLGSMLTSWKSKTHSPVSKSSIESEYRAMSNTCSEIIWRCGLSVKLGFPHHCLTAAVLPHPPSLDQPPFYVYPESFFRSEVQSVVAPLTLWFFHFMSDPQHYKKLDLEATFFFSFWETFPARHTFHFTFQ